MEYHALISYSRMADLRIAPVIKTGIERCGRAWYQAKQLHIFRDQTSLSASPALWGSISDALERSKSFILLASPTAAESEWIRREIEWWLTHRGTERFLSVITGGGAVWDNKRHDFDWKQTTSLPVALKGAFIEEPNYVNLRWIEKTESKLSFKDSRPRHAILNLVAALTAKPKDALDSEDIRIHRREKHFGLSMVAFVCVLVSP